MRMLPKAELHVHIEGTLEPELLVRLARRNGVALPSSDPEVLRAEYRFTSLQSFLDIYYRNVSVLRTEADFRDLAAAYLARAASGGVRRAEIFFDPQQHLSGGVPLETVFAGLSAGLAEGRSAHGISADLILCFLRDRGPDEAMTMLRVALPYRQHFIGVGLDSAEVGYPPALFGEVYAAAAAEGLHRVAHAGEEAGPDYVWQALDMLGAERIDHGIRAMEDPALVARLRAGQIPLTVCPLSNVALRAVGSLADHVLPAMLAEGLKATVNSDDPAYFGGYIDANFADSRGAMNLSGQQIVTLARNSFEACFTSQEQRNRWITELDAAAAQETAPAGPENQHVATPAGGKQWLTTPKVA
jgi:adenosine deaminase